ncbi:MAG: MBOAT family O-acyltransferase [Chitinophagales bacterium]
MNDWLEYLIYDPKSPLLFNSGLFLVLFILFSTVFLLFRKQKLLRIIWTVVFSLFFYYKSSGFYFWILIVSTVIDFILGHAIFKAESKGKKKALLILSLLSNLGILAYFKYSNFFIDTLNSFGTSIENLDIFLPIGISFYTFQTLSYSIDIYRGKLNPVDNILDFAFFVSFFPQLVAGPIVRAADFIPQIRSKLKVSDKDLGLAVLLIAGGLFKKAVISDYISINFVDRIFENPLLYSGFENLMGVYGYAMQIYCDFSGYSDMAIGLALLLGLRLPINFDSPYQSASITEFWRRWHISLSSWLKDYLYISLGGNRKGQIRTYFNLMMTMLLGGLWHGANWKFVFWGAMHGGMLGIEKLIKSVFNIPKNKLTRVLGVIFTFHFVCFCWIFFRADSFGTATQVLSQIGNGFSLDIVKEVFAGYRNILLMLLLGYFLHFTPKKWEELAQKVMTKMPLLLKAAIIALVAWMAVQIATGEVVPFIYFQF